MNGNKKARRLVGLLSAVGSLLGIIVPVSVEHLFGHVSADKAFNHAR
jgi:hypothetical protein